MAPQVSNVRRIFHLGLPARPLLTWGDGIVLAGLAALVYGGMRLAAQAPHVTPSREISLSPATLPLYAVLSVARMTAAYGLSLAFAVVYGGWAAHSRRAERVLLPILDVLQSVPILSFLPVVLLSLSAVLPQKIAAELAAVVLIFTSQAWNITFSWYQSLTTVPAELEEASTIFRFDRWLRFRTLLLPLGAIGLIWNSMMAWAGGWFFLMAAEIYTVGTRDFRLPGLGAYLQEAANRGAVGAVVWGVVTLVVVIVILDQFIWRPLLAWSDRFKLEMVEGEAAPTSWFYDALQNSRLTRWLNRRLLRPAGERIDAWLTRRVGTPDTPVQPAARRSPVFFAVSAVGAVGLLFLLSHGARYVYVLSGSPWGEIVLGLVATLARVAAALALSLAWTLPLGVAIGTNRRLAAWLQPLVQIAASIPATALFPVLLLIVLRLPAGLNLAAVLVMLTGTQWYLLFNIIAGASAIPQDLKYTTAVLQFSRLERWRTLILPALFPYLVTGAIAASGGAWNASIVAEYVHFGGQTHDTVGIGATIARATVAGDYPRLYAATLAMILAVVGINRLVWRRLYRIAETRYRIE